MVHKLTIIYRSQNCKPVLVDGSAIVEDSKGKKGVMKDIKRLLKLRINDKLKQTTHSSVSQNDQTKEYSELDMLQKLNSDASKNTSSNIQNSGRSCLVGNEKSLCQDDFITMKDISALNF